MEYIMIIQIGAGQGPTECQLAAQSTEERSQFQNKQRAMEKLQEKLAGLQREQDMKQVNDAWREHNRIVRGNPVRIYEGEKFVLKKQKGSKSRY